jgi:hypothetical protein
MKTLQLLMREILELTTLIETEYPELYKTLDETPVDLGIHKGDTVSHKDLHHYLETLRNLLNKYMEEHVKK